MYADVNQRMLMSINVC